MCNKLCFQSVKAKILKSISDNFQIDISSLHLTHPTFFSRITNATAKTVHDEYWLPHVDKETYSCKFNSLTRRKCFLTNISSSIPLYIIALPHRLLKGFHRWSIHFYWWCRTIQQDKNCCWAKSWQGQHVYIGYCLICFTNQKRLICFIKFSGAENLHFVEKVASGTRLALTVSFTCDKQFAINDPSNDDKGINLQ